MREITQRATSLEDSGRILRRRTLPLNPDLSELEAVDGSRSLQAAIGGEFHRTAACDLAPETTVTILEPQPSPIASTLPHSDVSSTSPCYQTLAPPLKGSPRRFCDNGDAIAC